MKSAPVSRISVAIAGAQKSGTTSLLRYLSQHPDLCGQGPVEFGYLFDEEQWRRGWEKAHARYFYAATGGRLVAKSAMLYARRICVERLAAHNPDCALVLVLRDPVERAFSSYRMERNGDWIEHPFDHIVSVLDQREHTWNRLFVQFGEYARALAQIYEFFAPEQVKVLIYEEFIADPAGGCQEVFRHLGVEDRFTPRVDVTHNAHRGTASPTAAAAVRWLRTPRNPLKRAARSALAPRVFDRLSARVIEATRGSPIAEQMDPRVREALSQYYLPLNRDLEAMLGRSLARWSGMSASALTVPSPDGASAQVR